MQSRSIDVGFTPQAETLLARAEKFRTTTLESGAFAWEFTDRGPNVAALREAARLGMTGIEVDRDLGGLGFGFREKVRIAEILSRSSIGFAFSLINTQNVAARLGTTGSDRHRDTYLPDLLVGRRFGATALTEPEAGSDFAAIATRAVRTDGGWVLNGQKAWITNAVIADVILCYAQTDPDRGRDGIACFVVDGRRSGFETTPAYQLVSGSTVGVGGFSLHNYEAVEDDMISEPGAGFRQALLGVNGARIYVAAMACAAVRAALGQAVDYGSSRESFGQPILAHQGLAWNLAAVANRLEAAEALTARAVDRHEESQAAVATDDGRDAMVRLSALAAAHAKKFATEMIEPALETCMQAMGAEGLRAEQVVGRLLSESRILGYVDGTTEMQTDRIGRSLTHYYGSSSPDAVSVAASTAAGQPEAADSSVGFEPTEAVEPIGDSEQPDERGFVALSEWSPDPFSPSNQGAGLFGDPVEHDREPDGDPVDDGTGVPVGPTVAGASHTMEFEPSEVTLAAGSVGGSPAAPSEAPTGPLPAMESPLPGEPPMPPSEPPPALTDTGLPSTPPMPPPSTGEPAGLGSPPPPPPPTGPPLSANPPLPSDSLLPPEPPYPSEPPIPPPESLYPSEPPIPPLEPPLEPPLSTDPPMPPAPGVPSDPSARPAGGPVPPVPPPEFQLGGAGSGAPPLPGEEHRLEADADDQPSTPPLPPDTMRTGG